MKKLISWIIVIIILVGIAFLIWFFTFNNKSESEKIAAEYGFEISWPKDWNVNDYSLEYTDGGFETINVRQLNLWFEVEGSTDAHLATIHLYSIEDYSNLEDLEADRCTTPDDVECNVDGNYLGTGSKWHYTYSGAYELCDDCKIVIDNYDGNAEKLNEAIVEAIENTFKVIE